MNIFIAFANQDRDVRDKLLRQMNLVAARQGWNIWSAKEIKAGERWGEEIERRLRESEVVILLLSTDFFNSEYIIEKELPEVVEKHKRGECQIIPIIARVCHWKDTPFGEYAQLGDIQALPVGEKPIVSRGWDNEDEPYFEVVQGVRDSIQAYQAKKQGKNTTYTEKDAIERLSILAQQQREREDQETFEKAQTPSALREYLKQGFTKYATKAQEILDTFPPTRPLVVVQEHNREENSSSCIFVLLLLIAISWLIFNSKIFQSSKPTEGSATTTDTVKLAIPDNFRRPDTTTNITKFSESSQLSESSTNRKSDFKMVKVEGGTFMMGSPASEEGRYDDECQHEVSVRSFYMGKYEVTQAQWMAVMGSNPSKFQGCDDCPVEQVSWNDVQEFIKKLNAATGKRYRLPTEAEWEYAAKGGNASKKTKYSGSDNLGSVAWYDGNSGSKTHPVGGKSPNELGLFDMSGNVWEWCADTWKPYPCDAQTNADSRDRVHRGGGAFDLARNCRAAGRTYAGASLRYLDLGFRLCSVSLQ